MHAHKPEYLIGIDLGTTNTVLAYADLSQDLSPENCHIFEIEQLVAPGEVAKRPQLPSFRYHPTKGEINDNDLVLPWTAKLAGDLPQVVVGEWARELGAKVEGRQVVSAKSWLSHPQVDRSAPILPWGSSSAMSTPSTSLSSPGSPENEGSISKVSPVLASASYLFHLKQAWNTEHPTALLEQQEVVITIPASFDEGARSLTIEATRLAGLTNILLLEEPQAVCYDWYAKQGDQAQALLSKIKLLLVCDVGGGTTDLSLIKIAQAKDNTLSLTRVGVGNHLMLGGDNVDLALAHIVEKHINGSSSSRPAKKLSAASLSQLIQQTRKAKERLLGRNAPDTAKVTLLGSGSKLIGGAKSHELSQNEVRALALDGFFPLININEQPIKRRSAVVEFGLPYAPDPAVSKYLAQFIMEHQVVCKDALDVTTLATPDALLLNGGVFNSPALNERAQAVLSHWHPNDITCLENNTPNLAVAQGAVAYAKARRGAQLKIGGGSARAFYLALEQSEGSQQAICLMPKGTEEEQELMLSERKFSLRLGQPVKFHLFSSTADMAHQAGELVTISDKAIASQHFISLPPLVAALNSCELNTENASEHPESKQDVEVLLATTLTEVGTLKIDCVEAEQQLDASTHNSSDLLKRRQRWHVEFEIRSASNPYDENNTTNTQASLEQLPPAFAEVKQLIEAAFNNNKKSIQPKAIKTLRIDIEKHIGKRDGWEAHTLRALFDLFLSVKKNRTHSPAHERIWFNLSGFSLRPGFGYPADEWRVEQIWKLKQQGLEFKNETQGWIDWWTFWRRAAGGLNAEQQLKLYKDIAKFLNPAALTSRKLQTEAKQKSYEDMVKLVAGLEHLPVEDKTQVAHWFLKRLEKNTETLSSWWALGRITSRSPFHGSAHNVIPKETVQDWLPQLLKLDWKKNQQSAFATVLMTRMSGDRSRDIDQEWRQKVIEKLKQTKAPSSWIKMVAAVKELDETETKRVFGEGLPPGLKLIQ